MKRPMTLWRLRKEDVFYFPNRPDLLLVKMSGATYRRLDGKPFPSGITELDGVQNAKVVPIQEELPME